MRVLRFIFRFLGISAAVLWVIGSIAKADDVTVNFPNQMEVTGNVQITNLGINGDPYFDYTPLDDLTSYNPTNAGTNTVDWNSTYIQDFQTVTFLRLNDYPAFVFKIPKFDWAGLKANVCTTIYGTKFGSTSSDPTGGNLFPNLFSGRNSVQSAAFRGGQTVVTDQIGSGSWEMVFDWKCLSGQTLPMSGGIDLSAWNPSTIRGILSIVLGLLAWFEVTYSIIGKLSTL